MRVLSEKVKGLGRISGVEILNIRRLGEFVAVHGRMWEKGGGRIVENVRVTIEIGTT